jgi:hypothetical protein
LSTGQAGRRGLRVGEGFERTGKSRRRCRKAGCRRWWESRRWCRKANCKGGVGKAEGGCKGRVCEGEGEGESKEVRECNKVGGSRSGRLVT